MKHLLTISLVMASTVAAAVPQPPPRSSDTETTTEAQAATGEEARVRAEGEVKAKAVAPAPMPAHLGDDVKRIGKLASGNASERDQARVDAASTAILEAVRRVESDGLSSERPGMADVAIDIPPPLDSEPVVPAVAVPAGRPAPIAQAPEAKPAPSVQAEAATEVALASADAREEREPSSTAKSSPSGAQPSTPPPSAPQTFAANGGQSAMPVPRPLPYDAPARPAPKRAIPDGAEPLPPSGYRAAGARPVYDPSHEIVRVEPTKRPPGTPPSAEEGWIGGRMIPVTGTHVPRKKSWVDKLLDSQRVDSLITYDRVSLMLGTANIEGENNSLSGEYFRAEFTRSFSKHWWMLAETELAIVTGEAQNNADEAALSLTKLGLGLKFPIGRPASLYLAAGPIVEFLGGEASNNIPEQEPYDFFGGTQFTLFGEVGLRTLLTKRIDFGVSYMAAPQMSSYTGYLDWLFGTGHAIGVEYRYFSDEVIEYDRVGLHYTYYF